MKKDYKDVEDKYKAWADILKAVSHPIRLYIIDLLSEGEKCVYDIDEKLHIDISTISRHLATLRRAGIVDSDKRGTQVYYRLKIPCVLNFFTCTENVIRETVEEKMKILNK